MSLRTWFVYVSLSLKLLLLLYSKVFFLDAPLNWRYKRNLWLCRNKHQLSIQMVVDLCGMKDRRFCFVVRENTMASDRLRKKIKDYAEITPDYAET